MIKQDKKNIFDAKRHGYILVITITLLSLAVVIVTRLANDSVLNISYVVNSYKRLKAQQLAFSGIDLGRSIISLKEDDPKKIKQFTQILLNLNRWQKYEIKLNDDSGLKCNLQFYLSSEQGKCNINQCLQFAKNEKSQKLEPNIWTIIAEPLGKILTAQDLKSATEEWAANRTIPLNDTTDLLKLEKFAYFNDKIVINEKMEYALDDIFTISTNDAKIQPYLLSSSTAKLLKLKNINDFTAEEWQELVKKAAEKFTENSSIEKNWDELFAPMFGKKISELPTNFIKVCSPKWDPLIFSIIVQVQYDNVFYALYAIISAEKIHRLYFI
jgi:hypothetical protein